ncbi:MAG: toll/interleukin-1 receptor domain-containing protein [Rhodospirillales bacterium]|nr:toll/interleukin-1 receptor domain-containing protein [Rhodospirillales bacterium]
MAEVVIYVVRHHRDEKREALPAAIAAHFDGDEPVRDGLGMRVPVRIRCKAWDGTPNGPPRPIAFDAADANIVVVLQSQDLKEATAGPWRGFFQDLAAERNGHPERTRVLDVSPGGTALPGLEAVQQVRTGHWPGLPDDAAWRVRLLLHVVYAIAYQLKARDALDRVGGGDIDRMVIERERLFLSHAKADGWEITSTIRDHLSKNTYGVGTFVDAFDLPGGTRFDSQFDAQIALSALVVLRSDRHGTRPWCRWEVLRAKAHNRPVLVVDLIEHGEPRVFPYIGNVPAMRVQLRRAAAGAPASLGCDEIERIVLAMTTEVLRTLIWRRRAVTVVREASAAGHPDVAGKKVDYFLRAPELVDVAFLRQANVPGCTLVYPDPPLDDHERPLIEAVGTGFRFLALSELESAR